MGEEKEVVNKTSNFNMICHVKFLGLRGTITEGGNHYHPVT